MADRKRPAMNRYVRFTLVALVLLGIVAGCATPGPGGDKTRICSADDDCVPEQCCHPTSCINRSYKGVCTELCTQVCEGPIDCGAGHCGCVEGNCEIISGPPKTYIMGIDAEYPPSTHLDESGNPAGLDVGSVTWIVQEEGFTVEFRLVTWNESIPALLGGDIDMIYSGMSITEERERQVNFSIPTGRSTSQWRYMVAVPGPFRIFWA